MVLVVHIRKLFVLPYLAASRTVGIQLEQGWALISCGLEAQILHADSDLACPTALTHKPPCTCTNPYAFYGCQILL